jgi:hypothetical protein
MNNYRDISLMWVSLAARGRWHYVFADIRRSLIGSTLSGVHDGVWLNRDLNLYGNSWAIFLSMVKAYNISYTAQMVNHQSNTARVCYSVYLTNANAEPDKAPPTSPAPQVLSFWDIACASPGSQFKTPTLIAHDKTAASLLLWEDIGLSLFANAPESLSCNKCEQLLVSHLNWMRDSGHGTDAGLLQEILSWPVEWSSFHGIEELRTPIFKLQATNWANPYHQKHCVQVMGDSYPAEGAAGLYFPYQQKAFKPVSDSASFKKGILHNTPAK